VGIALGALCWLGVGRPASGARLATAEARLAQVTIKRPVSRVGPLIDLSLVSPLFGAEAAAPPEPEPAVTVIGVTRTPRRSAALVSINGVAADWMQVGETRAGVTLQEVGSNGVVIATVNGPREIALGQTAASAVAMAPSTSAADDPPPGFRSPPPPASAPRTP
jgi:hypothetical protein